MPDPWQRDFERTAPVTAFDHRGISRVARMDAEVLVLSRRNYATRSDDPLSRVSNMDLAVAWGRAGQKEVRELFAIRQPWRRYSWTYIGKIRSKSEPEVVSDFRVSTANWHIIAADRSVEISLKDVREGEAVRLSGYLVDVRKEGGGTMRTSKVRDDQGDGACEIFLVEKIRRLS